MSRRQDIRLVADFAHASSEVVFVNVYRGETGKPITSTLTYDTFEQAEQSHRGSKTMEWLGVAEVGRPLKAVGEVA